MRVCRVFFTKTLHVSNKFLDKALLDKVANDGAVPIDKRGWPKGKQRKYTKDDIQQIREHIESFPTLESHYNRERSSKVRYLDERLNAYKMYQLYHEKIQSQGKEAVKMWRYVDELNTYKVKFGLPTVDLCDTCEQLNQRIRAGDTDALKALYLHHTLFKHPKKQK